MKLKNNVAIIISLCVAILLWFYVFGQVNPTIKTTVKNIPITLENVSQLEENGYAVSYQEYRTVAITFSAQRTKSGSIDESDFVVSCDVGDLEEGSETLRLNVTCPEDVNIETITTQTVKISVEKKKSVKKNIEVKIVNDNNDDTEPYIVQLSKSSVTITGAESLIDSIDKVVAELNAKKVSKDLGAYMSEVKALDSDGNYIYGLNYSVTNISISSKIVSKKTVPLEINVIGTEEERFKRTCEYPSVITIKGSDSVLENITSISAKDLDITDIYESCEVQITPILPSGVEIAWDSTNIHANVSVDKATEKTFTYNESDIKIVGLSNSTKATIDQQEITVTIAGPTKDVEKIEKDDISLTLNVKGLEAGTNKVQISLSCDVTLDKLKANPSSVNVNIR